MRLPRLRALWCTCVLGETALKRVHACSSSTSRTRTRPCAAGFTPQMALGACRRKAATRQGQQHSTMRVCVLTTCTHTHTSPARTHDWRTHARAAVYNGHPASCWGGGGATKRATTPPCTHDQGVHALVQLSHTSVAALRTHCHHHQANPISLLCLGTSTLVAHASQVSGCVEQHQTQHMHAGRACMQRQRCTSPPQCSTAVGHKAHACTCMPRPPQRRVS
jgi:hypothetical protein